jgi:transposase
MEKKKPQRRHSPEFRIEIAERMVAGESVTALSAQHELPRSMMYRWRDAYRKAGPSALSRQVGRPPGFAAAAARPDAKAAHTEEQLRQTISDLERKVGRQAVEIDFFKGVFKRLEELPKARRRGGEASTPRSGE